MIENPKRRHFHTLDALRFLSFFVVFLHHLPKSYFKWVNVLLESGGIGVSFFFVLSGFLITYILIQEKLTLGTINLRNFFARRILRIWPLFFAMLAFAFLTPFILNALNISFSNDGYAPNWLVSVFFLENYRMILLDSFPNVSPLVVMWSICVEEHFYIIWGLLFLKLNPIQTPKIMGFFVVLAIIARLVYFNLGWANLDVFTNMDYFAFGAIPAYMLCFKKDMILRVGKISKKIKYSIVFITLLLIFTVPQLLFSWVQIISPLVFGLLFASIILFTLPEKNAIKISDTSWLGRLGTYTYGLYLTHTIVINLLLKLEDSVPLLAHWFVFVIVALVLTIVLSIISYHTFEKQFLKLKRYFYR